MTIGILSPREIADLNVGGPTPDRVWRPSRKELVVNGSSIDLPLGEEYSVMKGSCRTGPDMKVSDLQRLFAKRKDNSREALSGPKSLKKNTVYLFKLDCELNLQDTHLRGKATARSSIGRLDVLVRLLTDESIEFDRVIEAYEGRLYAEVTPITFDLRVKPGTCLSQLRLFRGSERLVSVTQEEFKYEEEFPVVGPERTFASEDPYEVFYPFRLDLTPDANGVSGYVAKENPPGPIDPDEANNYDPEEFWQPVHQQDNAITLETNRLYILRSKERLRLPGHLALECQAYTETMGEWRIEYAGFAHPYFGHSRDEGSPLMFEVRGHNIPTILTDGIPLGNVCFKRMSRPAPQPPEPGQYEDQELKLSGCFKPWRE